MALYGPADRTIEIDTTAPVLTNFTALITSISGIGEVEQKLQEITGPGDAKPVHSITGFQRASDITVMFEADLGGSPDPVAEFLEDMSGSRTFTMTYQSAWTFSVETFIASAKATAPNEDHSMLEVVFRPTGAWTWT